MIVKEGDRKSLIFFFSTISLDREFDFPERYIPDQVWVILGASEDFPSP
jgi:hypothetical protein